MAEDRSLDEFLGADGSTDDDPRDAPAKTAGADEDAPEPDEDAAVEPMAETFAWSPAGGECAGCGATVEERWRDDDRLVCVDCKAW